ncbi:MAG: DICT sensory domain-containing protein [Nostocaceae cyanobacterium]|nr:DICT sensory domain-containing protein [Nostocaceae cyanobacterium]
MKLAPNYDVSLYQLALSSAASPQAIPISPATLLSVVRSLIDVLIEQQIAVKLWVKLPPGAIWYEEIQRYHSSVSVAHTIYTCRSSPAHRGCTSPASGWETPLPPDIPVQLVPSQHLHREYFFLVLSPQFSAVILAHRPPKKLRTRKIKTKSREGVKGKITASLQVITAFDGRVIQPVIEGMKQVIQPDLFPKLEADLQIPRVPEPIETLHLASRLLAQQLQHQDEICRHMLIERMTKIQRQKQELLTNLQLKDEYLSHLCQELRTPLTHMKTALSLLNSPNIKPPQRQRYLQMINSQCDQQNSLINGLLNLVQLDSSLEGTTLEPVRLSDIVPGVVSTYQPLAQEKGIMLAYILPSDLPPVSCVSTWLQQIVINLLHNSIKFTPNGGEVWVRSRIQGDYVQLELRDTGIGIAEAEIPKIFQGFYRVRPLTIEDPGGAGLGLTMVQQLLLRCGGSISVKSKLGEGSTFTVLLPIAGE